MAKTLSMDQLNELIECLASVKDPRVQGRSRHRLIDILIVSVCAMLCGAESVTDIEVFCEMKFKWLKKYLELPNGIPSYDTIGRVLSLVDPSEMEKAFLSWVRSIVDIGNTKSISLDGKCSAGTERSFNRGKRPLNIVSAYSHELGLSLVENQAQLGGGEVGSALACLELLDLKGVVVQVDAGIGSHEVVVKVIEKGGDYIVPVKGNQKPYWDEIYQALESKKSKVKKAESEEDNRGRQERRTCALITTESLSSKFHTQWPKAKTIFAICRERLMQDKAYLHQETGKDGKQSYAINDQEFKYSEETTFYVSSRKLSPKEALIEVRKHWGIENRLHWVLDVAFKEDNWIVRAKALARTLSLVRKMALNMIRNSKTKGSVKGRIKSAAWNNDFLEEVLFG